MLPAPVATPEAQARAESLLGSTLADRFRLEALLFAGKAGATYAAAADGGERAVVKVLYPELMLGEAGMRFQREAQRWPALRHPHVQAALGAGTDEPSALHYVAWATPAGHTLEETLAGAGALDPTIAVRVTMQIARGLEAAHRIGLLHRGLRPSAVLLEPGVNGELVVFVREFGLFQPTLASGAPAVTDPANLLDPPDYSAPEQLRNAERIDERADVFSLGAVLYEMLSGSPPFGHLDDTSDVVTSVLTDEVPHLQDRAPWIGPELTRVVHRALAHNPNARFATCEEMLAALRPFSEDDELVPNTSLRTVGSETRSRIAARAEVAMEPPPRSTLLAAETDDMALVGRQLDGKYRVLGLLGRGGMGSVYEVEGPDGDRLAAKVISRGTAGDNPAALLRFAREAKAATAIQSLNVVRTLDAGTDEALALPYIIMELLHGIDLSKVMKAEGALEPQTAVRLVLQAGRGIAAAHARHIVHRDIKPANLFLEIEQQGNREVTVKVCDFGVAKRKRVEEGGFAHSHMSLTRTGGMLGSPMYMAPEQARNAKSVDERADIWSLSIVLWEALSGERLWGDKKSLGELVVSICTEPIRRLEEVAPWVPKDLARVVHKGLERDLSQRTPSMHSLIAALELFAGGSDRVTGEQLVGMSEERLAELTRRVSTPDQRISGSLRPSSARPTAPTVAAPQSSSRGLLIGLLLVLALGAVAAVVLMR